MTNCLIKCKHVLIISDAAEHHFGEQMPKKLMKLAGAVLQGENRNVWKKVICLPQALNVTFPRSILDVSPKQAGTHKTNLYAYEIIWKKNVDSFFVPL